MPDLDLLMGAARDLATDVLTRAADALNAGAPIARVQRHYVARAAGLLAEAEAQAVLASGGSPGAIEAIERCIRDLADLGEALTAGFPQRDGET